MTKRKRTEKCHCDERTGCKRQSNCRAPQGWKGKRYRRRRIEIIKTLTAMSRDWSKYKAADWQPLETELRQINGTV